MERGSSRARWRFRHWAFALCLAVASMLVTSTAWMEAFRLSLKDEEMGYVLIAPVFIAWLVWVRRERLPYCRPGGGWVGVAFMALGWFLWSYGYRRSALTFWYAGPVLIAAGAFLSVVGKDVLRKFLPAFVALIFLVPITPRRRQIIAAPLENSAAGCTQTVCELLGLHVERYGNLLSVNGTDVEVAEACNGMRQVITFWLVCYVLAFSQPLRGYIRVLLLLAAPLVAVGSNVVRLVPTVWVYSFGAGETAERFHEAAGWAMLVVAFAVIFGMIAALRWAMVPVRHFQLAAG